MPMRVRPTPPANRRAVRLYWIRDSFMRPMACLAGTEVLAWATAL
jgi:hypothetical protein